MSIDTTHVALANEQQLQQMVGSPDPRVSIPAAARLAKLIQGRKMEQNQQAMGMPQQPTVRDQLQQAAAPAPMEGGIAMAAGGIVQRNFSTGTLPMPDAPDISVPGMTPGTIYEDKMAEINSGGHEEGDIESAFLKVPRALRDLIYSGTSGIQHAMGDPTWAKLGQSAQDLYTDKGSPEKQAAAKAAARIALEHPELATQLAAKTAPKLPLGIGTQGPTAAQLAAKLNPKAAKPNTGPGSGLDAAVSTDTLESGPVNGTKVKAASEGGGELPEDTHMQRADELIAQLDPLQKERLAQLTASKSAEEARYKALQEAKHDPNKFVDTMNRIVEITRPFANANVGRRGNFGSLLEGSHELAKNDQALRTQQANEEAAHQKALAGITAGMTDQQIKDLLGNYGVKNTALTADQSEEIKRMQAAQRVADAAEKKRVDDATIEQKKALAAKARGAGGGASMKGAMTPAQYGQLIEKHITNAMNNRGLSHEEALAEAKTVVPPIGTPVALQSNASAPASTGDLQSAAAAEIARRAAKQ
jgi:hypothetical protein